MQQIEYAYDGAQEARCDEFAAKKDENFENVKGRSIYRPFTQRRNTPHVVTLTLVSPLAHSQADVLNIRHVLIVL